MPVDAHLFPAPLFPHNSPFGKKTENPNIPIPRNPHKEKPTPMTADRNERSDAEVAAIVAFAAKP